MTTNNTLTLAEIFRTSMHLALFFKSRNLYYLDSIDIKFILGKTSWSDMISARPFRFAFGLLIAPVVAPIVFSGLFINNIIYKAVRFIQASAEPVTTALKAFFTPKKHRNDEIFGLKGIVDEPEMIPGKRIILPVIEAQQKAKRVTFDSAIEKDEAKTKLMEPVVEAEEAVENKLKP